MPKRTPHISLRPQNNKRARLAPLLVLFLLLPSQWTPVLANTPPSTSAAAGSTQSASTSNQAAIHTIQHQTASLVLDLSSTLHNAVAPQHLSQAVSIIEGGVAHSINAGAALTSAERLAVSQVLATGHQSLILSAAGVAAGGTFALTPGLSSHISGLVIPAGVTALDNISKTPNLSLSGNLTNDGTLVAYASGAVTHAVANITAVSIFNQSSGIITTTIPAALTTRLVNTSPVDLALTATNTLVNAGIISSSGALSIAAGSINNNPAASNIVAAGKPTIQSANDLNIFTSSGNLGNGGTISTTLGNINLTTSTINNLVVNSTGGVWNASKGYISLGDLLNTNKVDATLNGGTFNSSALNINSGNGTIDVNANRISAMVNMVGGVAHLTVHDGALELGTLKLSGDPTFYNTGGNLLITGNLNYPGQDLAIIAAGNVLATSGLSSISAADLTIIAGANFTVTSASPIAGSSSATVPSSNQAAAADVVSVLGSTATGGNINLTGAAAGLTITTTGSSHSTFIAFNPVNSSSPASDGTNGQVLLPTGSTINNGVYVYSEASAQTSVQLGTVHGGVGIYDKQLMPSTLQFTNGTMTTGSLNTVSNGYLFGTVSLNAVTGGTGNVDIEVGGSATSNISMGDLAVYNQLKLQGNNIEGGAVTFSAPAAQDSILGFGNTVAFVSINPTSGVNTSPFSGQVLVGQDKECMFCSTYPYGTGAVGPAAGGAGSGSVTTSGGTTLIGLGSTGGSSGAASGITFGSGTGGGFGLAAGSLTGSTSGAITLGTAAFALAAGGTNSASSGGLYFGRTPLDNTPSSGTSGIAFGSGGTSGVAFGSGSNGGGGLSLPSGSLSYWASAIRLGQAILASSTNQKLNANSNYWYNYQWTETAAQPDEPSYYEKAMAMAAISQARADAILKQDQVLGISPGYDYQTAIAAAQQWKNYASIGGSDGGTQASYGVAPQIVQYPGTWLDMIQNSGPTVYNYLPQGFYDWANKYSGGKPITNYTTTESGSAFNPTPPDDSTSETADQNTQKQFDANNIRDPYTGNLIDSTHLSYDPATGEYVNKDTLQRYNPTTQQWTTDNGDPIQAKYYDQKTRQWVTTNGDPLFKGTALNQPIYDPVTGQAIDRQYLSVSPDGTVTDTRNGNVFSRVSNSWTDADGNAITSLAQIKDTKGNLLDPTKLAVDDSGTITNKANGQTYNPTTGVWTNSNGTVAGFSDGRTVNNPITSKPVDLNDMQYDATTGKVTDVQNNLTYDPKTNVWTNQYGEPLQNIGSVAAHNLAYDFSTHRFTDTSTGNVYDPLLKQWFSPDGNAIPNAPQAIADQGKPANTTINGPDGKPLTTDNVLATADVGKVVDTTTNNTFDKTADPGKNWTDQYGYTVGPQPPAATQKDNNGVWAAPGSQTEIMPKPSQNGSQTGMRTGSPAGAKTTSGSSTQIHIGDQKGVGIETGSGSANNLGSNKGQLGTPGQATKVQGQSVNNFSSTNNDRSQTGNMVVSGVNSVLGFHPFLSTAQTLLTVNLIDRTTSVDSPMYQPLALAANETVGVTQINSTPPKTYSRDWLPPAAVPIVAGATDVEIKTNYGSIYCDRGSAAVCLDLGKALCIYVLESHGKHSVRMFYRHGQTRLRPGKAYLLTDEKAATVEKVLGGSAIPIRNISTQRSSARSVLVGDFPIPTALLAVPGMTKRLQSTDKQTRMIMHNVLKNATILSQLQQPDGPYNPGP